MKKNRKFMAVILSAALALTALPGSMTGAVTAAAAKKANVKIE